MRRGFKAGTGFGAAEKLETDLESYRFEPETICGAISVVAPVAPKAATFPVDKVSTHCSMHDIQPMELMWSGAPFLTSRESPEPTSNRLYIQ
jgi:hypothetical protein